MINIARMLYALLCTVRTICRFLALANTPRFLDPLNRWCFEKIGVIFSKIPFEIKKRPSLILLSYEVC